MSTRDPAPPKSTLAQGDVRLLQTDLARELLGSAIPARVAYVARDGTPRVVPSWFHWTGDELVMPTFVSAPHIRAPASRLKDLRANPAVAVTIDTESPPPRALLLRGHASTAEADGVAPEYAMAARRFLGEPAATEYLTYIDQPGTRMARIALVPTWVGLIDFGGPRLPTNMVG